MKRLAWIVATVCGCGRTPVAQGTAGSLAALAIAWPLWRFAGFGRWHFLILAILATAPAIWAAGVVEREIGFPYLFHEVPYVRANVALAEAGAFGALRLSGWCRAIPADVVAHETGSKDPGLVVADEVVGQWIALAGAVRFNWKSWLAAFLLFRLFDVIKPPPARQLENVPGGAGIVLDDVAAGIYAALVLFAAGWFNLY